MMARRLRHSSGRLGRVTGKTNGLIDVQWDNGGAGQATSESVRDEPDE